MLRKIYPVSKKYPLITAAIAVIYSLFCIRLFYL